MKTELFLGLIEPSTKQIAQVWPVSSWDDFATPESVGSFLNTVEVAKRMKGIIDNPSIQWTLYRAHEAGCPHREVIGQWPRNIVDTSKGIEMIIHAVNIAAGHLTRATIDLTKLYLTGKLGRFKERLATLMRVKETAAVIESMPFKTTGFPERVIGLLAFKQGGFILYERPEGERTPQANRPRAPAGCLRCHRNLHRNMQQNRGVPDRSCPGS